MNNLRPFPVVLENGETATLFATSRFLDDSEDRLVRLRDGREFLVPKSALEARSDGTYVLRTPIAELGQTSQRAEELRDDEAVIPVIEEQLEVGRRERETGRIRLNKSIETREIDVEEPLLRRTFDIERVPVDRMMEKPVEPWYDGDTLVFPVFEEVLVVEKRLVMREEIRLTRRTEERLERQTIEVKREHVDVERVP